MVASLLAAIDDALFFSICVQEEEKKKKKKKIMIKNEKGSFAEKWIWRIALGGEGKIRGL
ncbi:hypothetical protein L484_011980 [Morus notabilis]|uniref:Uncharacterized protein n=1 Tax=Morus notabilis TaxID=981085 RepID=W9RPY1_9ROSA|nr:hypothetical protein L484_011980 [Morus notabilis]